MTPAPADLAILQVAKQAGLTPKRIGQNEWTVRCPGSQGHRNGDRHPSCRLNDVKQTYYCDVCSEGGGVLEFARATGVEVQQMMMQAHPRSRNPATRIKNSLQFASGGPISATTQALFATKLNKKYTAEAWARFGVLEGTVKDQPAIAFPQPGNGYKACLYRKPDTRRGKPYSFVFTDGGRADLLIVGDGPRVVLTAGEWDLLAALSAGITCVATGTGGEGTWKSEWSSRLKGKQVVISYDVDPAGIAGAEKVRAALRGIAAQAVILKLPLSGDPEKDGKDLSDYLAIYSPAEILDLIASAMPVAGLAGLENAQTSLGPVIDEVLSSSYPVRLKRRDAAKIVTDDLLTHGRLIHSPGGRRFWFDNQEQQLLPLEGTAFRSHVIKRYEINAAEPEFRHIMEAIVSVCSDQGVKADVYRFAFYDQRKHQLYISAGRGRVLRLDGSQAVWVQNGDDGVLFEDRDDFDLIPEQVLSTPPPLDALGDLILSRLNFIRGDGVVLTDAQQRLLLRVWILSVFFPEILPSKVLLLLYGEKGSGKTTTLRALLKLLSGPCANVTPLTSKEDGFNAAVSSEFLLVLDNVDSHSRWIEDRLATVSTGQTIRLRKLYTTNEMISFPTRCCIALTARTPRFRRDDVVDRLLILRVNRLASFSRESTWYEEIEQHRVALWSQLIRDLNATIAQIRAAKVTAPERVRMADWGFLAAAIGEAIGQGDETRRALEAAEIDKAHFLLEADEIHELLLATAEEHPNQRWKAGEIFGELKRRAEASGIEFGIKSPKSLGRALHRLRPALQLMMRFEIETSPHDGQAIYVLAPLPVNEYPNG